jgi:hypothetical protein
MNNLSSVNAHYNINGDYQTLYPPQPTYSPECTSNVDWDTLPNRYPARRTILGPASLKHLYRGPQYYPPQTMVVPKDTLYGFDNSVYNPGGARRTYGTLLYPFTNRSPREVIEYADGIIPMPAVQQWTKYPTLHDGAWGR